TELMTQQRQRSKRQTPLSTYGIQDTREKYDKAYEETEFAGYEEFEAETKLATYGKAKWGIKRIELADTDEVVLFRTPFYAEAGGQVGDTGRIFGKGFEFAVADTIKRRQDFVHIGRLTAGTLEEFSKRDFSVRAIIDKPRRINIQRNHSATHLVHEALRRVLGTHLHQQGSLVAPDRLRFDFPQFGKITPEEIRAIEDIVNEKISDNISVFTEVDMPIEKARKIPNVKMFFGDKYGDTVRVVFIDEKFSVEFCGGTHVKSTKDIGLFKIISESSIASGMRRIEAITGKGIQKYIDEQLIKVRQVDDQLAQLIEEKEMLERELNKHTSKPASSLRPSLGVLDLSKTSGPSESIETIEENLREREQAVEQVTKQTSGLKKEIGKQKLKDAASGIDELVGAAPSHNGFKVVSAKIDANDIEQLKSIGDTLRSKLVSGVGVLASIIDEKVALVCVVTDDLIKAKNLQAGKIVGQMAKQVGGGGGGRPHLATAGGKDVAKLHEALRHTSDIVRSMLSR
ncbi:MAG: alanine--tRNA ligase-related protein, partial [Ignavibacteria bacterium]|nr:alanine--tRNA ligase-related protein [Ignavibacteria bacterium]